MGFDPDFTANFELFFEEHKEEIRSFPGCLRLELYRDMDDPSVFFTYSFWEDPQALETYRNSPLFHSLWEVTKKGFNRKPEAWSVNRIHHLH